MDVVRHVRRAAGGAKTGHAGTLDPLATGVVVCCLGPATRDVPLVMAQTKIYEAEVDLSAFTTTDDREGARREVAVAAPPDEARLCDAIAPFVGVYGCWRTDSIRRIASNIAVPWLFIRASVDRA